MRQYTFDELIEANELFMKLCEEFPELYDVYIKKIEKEMNNYKPKFELTEEEKKQAIEKIWNKIHDNN